MDHIVYQLLSDVQEYFEYFIKNDKTPAAIPSTRLYINKTENKITFKINSGYYLEL